MKVFVDTSALLALLDEDESRHLDAVAILQGALQGVELVTHNYVLVEAMALARRRLGAAAAIRLVDVYVPALTIVWVDETLHHAAVEAHRAGPGGPSFVDQVSFQVMRAAAIDTAFAYDRDFGTAGFGFASREQVRPHRLSEAAAPYDASRIAGSDLASVSDLAARSGRPVSTIQSWRRRHDDFPAPLAALAAGPVWSWPEVAAWIRARARPRHVRDGEDLELPVPDAWRRTPDGRPTPNGVDAVRLARTGR